jgi:signal transduction histidine kinase
MMKKQRTNNPRFLAALGFLGFLGAFGSRNPDVTRWAWLSLLSLFSLLVLIPTMDIDSKKASYRLLPRRKWMLVLLAFLGFLGFLLTDNPRMALLASLASMAQLAIDHKKKSSVSVKELMPIFALLFVAIILPVGGMLWFMTAAIRNEQVAVRQRLTEVYESQLDTAFQGVEESIGRQRTALAKHAELAPARRFGALVRDSFADGILVLDEKGWFAYPANPSITTEALSAEALSLQSKVRNLLRTGSFPEARQVIDRMASDAAWRDARDESGRLILPALQLFYVQSASEPDAILEFLRKTVTDYETEMSSAQRLFYLQALAQLEAEMEPWLTAETLAAELEDVDFDLEARGYWPVLEKGISLLFSDERRTAAVFRSAELRAQLHEQVEVSSTVKGMRIQLQQNQDDGWLAKPFPNLGDGWFIGLHIEADDPFAATADRRVVRYIWTGMALITVMGFSFMLLVRSLLAQQRLTRMKNDFVATVTHELKTPLASTRLFVDTLLEGRCRDEQQQREYLELIARENKRLSRLIDNFLTFSRMERNKKNFCFEDCAPASIATIAADAVRENYECANCKISIAITDGLPPIVADTDAMVTVLLNLLDNACKYSNGDKRIELRVFEKDHAICFQVEDNGIGIPKRELSKIMERFYQIDQSLTRKVGGAGLGLSIVNFIVEAHGGKIGVESEPDVGSVFTVTIPLNGGNHGE